MKSYRVRIGCLRTDKGLRVSSFFGEPLGNQGVKIDTVKALVIKDGVVDVVPRTEWQQSEYYPDVDAKESPTLFVIPDELFNEFLEALDKFVQAYKK
jgi:hypothetical protein